MKTKKLQGMGELIAEEMREVEEGNHIMYNHGGIGKLIKKEISETGKSYKLTTIEKGKEYTSRKNANTLVAVLELQPKRLQELYK